MLVVHFKDPLSGKFQVERLQLDTISCIKRDYYGWSVTSLNATGTDLVHIRGSFENLPMTTGTSCWWFDDYARFIFHNLAESL